MLVQAITKKLSSNLYWVATPEASVLLKHPDQNERALALKLSGLTPEDIALAILDPSQKVFEAAFNHPQSQHALDVLAAVSRDAAGNPIHDRHDLLLKDPRCTDEHVRMMHRAIKGDIYLPVQDQANRLKVFQLHTGLHKSEKDQIHLDNYDDPNEEEVKVSQEESRHPELLKIYNQGVNSSKPIRAQDADLGQEGKFPKAVYSIPTEQGNHKFIVKPYMEDDHPLGGWNESTSQELYGAAGISHLHQKSFVGSYNNGNRHIPVTVIHVEKSQPIHKVDADDIVKKNPKAPEDARKIALMDFLTGNGDRHTNNLMVKDDGQLLAIDHGLSFSYSGNPMTEGSYEPKKANVSHFGRYSSRAPSVVSYGDAELPGASYHSLVQNWWPTISPDVRRAFQKRLELIGNPSLRKHLELAFNARHQWLDNAAKIDSTQFLQELKKAIEGQSFEPVVEQPGLVADMPASYKSVHKELLTAHPVSLQPKVEHFETYVNHPTNPVKAERSNVGGIEDKSIVKHADQTYLLKAANTKWNHLSGWGELSSQAMYHAGGIGHLHQDVHATNLNIKEGDQYRTQPIIAIHFKPGDWNDFGLSVRRLDLLRKNHSDEVKKAALMDFLTGNGDRHDQNALIDKKGNLQLIDHSFAFRRDNHDSPESQDNGPGAFSFHGPGAFSFHIFNRDNVFIQEGFKPDENTYQWWLQAKQPMIETFNKFLDMIPDKKERDRRRAVFDYRVKAIDSKHPKLFGEDEFGKAEALEKVIKEPRFGNAISRAPDSEAYDVHPKHLNLLPEGKTKNKIKKMFSRNLALIEQRLGPFDKQLKKSLGNAEFLHDQHVSFPDHEKHPVNTTGLHERLLGAHPAAINPGVRHFEIAINSSKNPLKPSKTQKELKGIQSKALYHHNNKGYLIKPAIESSTKLGAWNELTSQALYHAGSIGHLHQKVHATIGKTDSSQNWPSSPAHALAIHMAPDTMPFNDAYGWDEHKGKDNEGKDMWENHPGKDLSRSKAMLWTPQHLKSLGQIGVMDYLTSNPDRHGFNFVVAKDGSPIAIDHSRSFYEDRKHAFGEEYDTPKGELLGQEAKWTSDPEYQNRYVDDWRDHMRSSAAAGMGNVDQGTLDWWEKNKVPMLEKFKEHVTMLPDLNARQKMVNSFMVRYNRVGDLLRNHLNNAGQKPTSSVTSEAKTSPLNSMQYANTNPVKPSSFSQAFDKIRQK